MNETLLQLIATSASATPKDEYDILGISIATKLRKIASFNSYLAWEAQDAIENTIKKYEREYMARQYPYLAAQTHIAPQPQPQAYIAPQPQPQTYIAPQPTGPQPTGPTIEHHETTKQNDDGIYETLETTSEITLHQMNANDANVRYATYERNGEIYRVQLQSNSFTNLHSVQQVIREAQNALHDNILHDGNEDVTNHEQGKECGDTSDAYEDQND